ncbi:hypothetical protein, partial [Niastella yeongjuensis]
MQNEANKYRALALWSFIIGILITTLIFICLDKEERTVPNGFTIFGTFFSIFGLMIAFIQIKSLRESSEETKIAIDNSITRINQVLSVSDLSKSTKLIHEIQGFLQNNKLEMALIRMKDLKAVLIQVKYNEDLLEYTHDSRYNQNITGLGADISNLHDEISGIKKGINLSMLNK